MLTEFRCFKETGLVQLPEHLSFVEAATLPCAAVTAWNAAGRQQPEAGATVLILGTGGVSIFALQLAKLMGARVLGISSSAAKLERARSLGLDAGLNYRETPAWERWAMDQTAAKALTCGRGGRHRHAASLPRRHSHGGVIAQIGVLAGPADPLPLALILHKQARIQGIYVGSRKDFEEMNRAISLAALRPVTESFPGLRHASHGPHGNSLALGKLVTDVE